MADPVLTPLEVAVLLEVAKQAVYTMVKTGQIPGLPIWDQRRFKHEDLDRWIDDQNAVSKGNIAKDAPSA
jgi:excisionase family DNA binding protein